MAGEEAGTPGVFVTYEGILGEILTATPRAAYEQGRWWIDRVARQGGDVEVRQGERRLRGRLSPASEKDAVVEVR